MWLKWPIRECTGNKCFPLFRKCGFNKSIVSCSLLCLWTHSWSWRRAPDAVQCAAELSCERYWWAVGLRMLKSQSNQTSSRFLWADNQRRQVQLAPSLCSAGQDFSLLNGCEKSCSKWLFFFGVSHTDRMHCDIFKAPLKGRKVSSNTEAFSSIQQVAGQWSGLYAVAAGEVKWEWVFEDFKRVLGVE